MNRPFIGINCDVTTHQDGTPLHTLRAPYVEAIWKAGGRPVLLPTTTPERVETLLAGIDGLLLSGGDDLDPRLYGGTERHPEEVPLDPLRESCDMALIELALAAKTPILGVCCGLQELAVASRGTLHPFIPDCIPHALRHTSRQKGGIRHAVDLCEGSRLRAIMGPRIEVNSVHRQAVAAPGRALRTTGLAPDGVIEAIEGDGPVFVVGVQWHPELLLDEPGQLALFQAFVEAARVSAAACGAQK